MKNKEGHIAEEGNPETSKVESGELTEEDLAGEVARLREENQALREARLRSIAEIENMRRRTAAEREQIVQFANERLLKELLPVLDDFQRSLENAEKTEDYKILRQGLDMVYEKYWKVLEGQGVRRIEAIGQPFDVELHEAMLRQPSDQEEDTVVGELEPGYTYGDKVLRHSKVIVSAG